MSSLRSSIGGAIALAIAFVRAGTTNVVGHWPLAGVSLVAAFGVWFVIQDVDANPRVQQLVPVGDAQQLRVQVDGIPDGYIVVAPRPIQVKVDARKQDIPQLRSTDFDARANADGLLPDTPASVPVKVTTRKSGVTVIGAEPASVELTLVKAQTIELPVEIVRTGRPPEGYVETDAPAIEPAFVKVIGRPEQVASVKSVSVEMNLSGQRDATVTLDGDLVARTESGNTVAITLSQTSARVTFHLEQTFAQRTIPIMPIITGSPAAGYYVAAISVDTPVVVVTGLKAFVDGLRQMNTEKMDITNANRTVVQSRQLDRPPNVSLDRQTVSVRVEIRPIDCGAGQPSGPCGSATMLVAPLLDTPPAGLVVESTPLSVQVHLSGPVAQLAALKSTDLKATVALAGAKAGAILLPVVVTAPSGIKVESVELISITFRAVTP